MDWVLVLVISSLFFAAFLQSATGFGMAIVCMALLPLVIPVSDAIAFVSLACFAVTVVIMLVNRGGLSWKKAGPLAIGMVVGIPLGFFGLRWLDSDGVLRVLGVVLVAIALWELIREFFGALSLPDWTGGAFGLLGGLLAGGFNVGGPALVVFTHSRSWSKVEIIATLQSVFLLGGITRIALMIPAGDITAERWRYVIWAIPFGIAAVFLGKLVLDRIPQAWFRRIVFGMILLIGVRYLL
ncbi:MAG: sulfite exporter TauE/SafE family protein [Verrucomicrobiota bacterium]